MKKFWAILLVVVMLLYILPTGVFAQTTEGEVIASGSCGDNLSWALYENGFLIIDGTGDMTNWNFWDVSAPWLSYSEQIRKVIIEEGVTSIGQNAFCSEDSYFDYNDHFYSSLIEIVIPNTVTTIQTNGISGLDVLETITLPPSVTTLVGAAINNNYALKNFVVAEENPVYKAVDGVLFSKDGKTLVSYPIGATLEEYTIPQGTETIAAYAFSQCATTLKKVIFNEELTFIDDEAFQNCDGLTSIELPDSLKQLGGGVFQECTNLSDISLPEGMTRIGGRAFDCTGYYNDWSNWEDNVLYIGPYLLETTYVTPELDWEDWKEKSGTLNVRAGTTLIADESVDSSDVDAVMFNNGLQHIGFCAFGWLDIASISLPDSLISLGDWAFYNCELLEDIHIGSNLQYIGHDVFGNTPYDKADNYVDGVLYYGPYVLGFNDSLPNDVVLRDGTTLIAERAFWKEDGRLDSPDYGANMQSITFPESLKIICDGAFYSCNNLKTITIPPTVTHIGHQAYGWVKGYDLDIDEETFEKMTDVTIKGYNDTAAHNYAKKNDITFVSLDEPAPEVDEKYGELLSSGTCGENLIWKFYNSGTFVISGEGAMKYYDFIIAPWQNSNITENMTALVIENGVTSISESAFSDCKNLANVILPNSLTSIDYCAFENCTMLEGLTLPDSITNISNSAFRGCDNLKTMTIGANFSSVDVILSIGNCKTLETVYISQDNPHFSFEDGVIFNKDKTELVLYLKGNSRTSYTTPNGVEIIGKSAFSKCNLSNIIISYGVKTIGVCAFDHAVSTDIVLPNSLETIEDGAFRYTEFTNIIIPNSVKTIGAEAFHSSKISSISIPDSVTCLGRGAFWYAALTEITLGSGIKTIDELTFTWTGLKNVVIPNGVESIGMGAFACPWLEKVTIPASVTNIGEMAFTECSSLIDVYYGGTAAQKEAIVMGEGNSWLLNATWHNTPIPEEHEHTFENNVYDNNSHWTECGCGEKENVRPHSFENDCDVDCDCGYTRTVAHNYDNLKYSDTHHWNECDCGAKTGYAEHKFDITKKTEDEHWRECSCGKEEFPYHFGHGYSRVFDDDNHWLECECGATTDKEAHNFNSTLSDETSHWKECFCGKKTEQENHKYDSNCDAECNICKYNREVSCHIYDDDFDSNCNLCGEFREITFTGWHSDGVNWYYYENGNIVKNAWRKDSKGWVFLGKDGAMLTNAWCTDSAGWCYVGADGYAVTNCWKKDSVGWIWLNSNGSMTKSAWVKDGGNWYYLNADGYMVSNCWKQDSKGWVYLGKNGAMLTNAWCTDSAGWCYVGADGYAVTNCWKKDSIGWIWLNGSGSMTKSAWVKDGGKWYYLNANGYMVTGKQTIGGKNYIFNSSGVWVG